MSLPPKRCLLLDWGDTVMRVFPEYAGPMADWPRMEAVAGVREALAALKPTHAIALATNAADSDERAIREALRRAGLLDLFDRVYCCRSVGHKKPSLAFFLHVLADLGLPATDVLMVGDDFAGDVLGANAVGIPAVWLNARSGEVREGPLHRTIHSFASLAEVVADMRPKSV